MVRTIDILDELWLSRHPYDKLFLSLIEGCEIKYSNTFPTRIFYVKNHKIIIMYSNDITVVDFATIWNEFIKCGLKKKQISELLNDIIYRQIGLIVRTYSGTVNGVKFD